ncbi:MAG: hypothetical protein ACK2UO_06340 [Caldilineaceae bacterium]
MSYYPDLGTKSQIDSGAHIRAVGWLDDKHKYSSGDAPPGLVLKLEQFAAKWAESVEALGWPVACGTHVCELCGKFESSGNFGVPAEVLFVCPEMIAHYVAAHAYLPPQEFVEAVMSAPLPGTPEYVEAVATFAGAADIWK